MRRSLVGGGLAGALTSATLLMMPLSSANAEDFFSALFRAFGGRHNTPRAEQWAPFSYGSEPSPQFPTSSGDQSTGGPAYCVRTCDGRYFPAPPVTNQSRAEACRSFCPASETTVFYGRNIDGAVSDKGKVYSQLPNAFKYRSELVTGCSCNGKDPVGLASVRIEDDKTLRRGDIVAGPNTVETVGKAGRRSASMNFSPVPQVARSRYARAPAYVQN
jgi:Protein of unknown function (DUF2865)